MPERTRAVGAVVAVGRRARDAAASRPAVAAAAAVLRALVRREALAGRGALWLPVAFGLGILVHLQAETEPSLAAALLLAAALVAMAVAARRRPLGFALAVAAATMACGFAAATLRTALVFHPALATATGLVTVTGFVADRDQRERSDRVVLHVTAITPPLAGAAPRRVRLVLRPGSAPAVGAHVALRTRLEPLAGPAVPGGYDFARDAWFSGIGARGLAFGAPALVVAPGPPPLAIAAWTRVDALRTAIGARIHAALPGETGAVAKALVTGERDALSERTNEALRVSGLYHVISISGLHMVLVVGVVFALVRGSLALVPGLALRRPIKRWAAAAALAAAAFYLVLSGAEVATVRAFLMTGLVLVGVLVDRAALTLRTLAGAALVVLALAPDSLWHPGFQMSFAATLALVALYERWAPRRGGAAPGGVAGIARTAGLWVAGVAATALVAGLATAPFAIHHFHRVSPYGVLANLLAMPVVSVVVMPSGLAAVLALPFGFDRLPFEAMGFGIDAMMRIAAFVATLPGADARLPASGPVPLFAATAALLAGALLVGPLRLIAVPLGALAVLGFGAPSERPDVLVDAEARVVAVRAADGRLAVIGRDAFVVRNWLDADGDVRPASDPSLAAGVACDPEGCVARLPSGAAIAVPKTLAALEEDCARAALVVTRLTAAMACAARRLDPATLARTGAVALVRDGEGWRVRPARDAHYDRPWIARPPDVPRAAPSAADAPPAE